MLKKIILKILIILICASPALANWASDFEDNFKARGIEVAIAKALEKGKNPNDIVTEGLKIENINPQSILKALYCEGVDGDDVRQASELNGISDIILISAFERSIAECGDAVVDSQAYTKAANANFSGFPTTSHDNTRTLTASPSTF